MSNETHIESETRSDQLTLLFSFFTNIEDGEKNLTWGKNLLQIFENKKGKLIF